MPEVSHQNVVVMKKHIRVLVVGENGGARNGLKRVLETESGMKVVASFGSADEALPRVRKLAPDVILMDADMPGLDGIEATRYLKGNGLGCEADVILLAREMGNLVSALEAGAAGYLPKDIDGNALAQSIRQVCQNEHVLPGRRGLVDQLELVIPPSTDAERLRMFIIEVEERLKANVLEVVGSAYTGTSLTIAVQPASLTSVTDVLSAMPVVESVEDLYAGATPAGFSRLLQQWTSFIADLLLEKIAYLSSRARKKAPGREDKPRRGTRTVPKMRFRVILREQQSG